MSERVSCCNLYFSKYYNKQGINLKIKETKGFFHRRSENKLKRFYNLIFQSCRITAENGCYNLCNMAIIKNSMI